jgi:hypothetical protein
LVGCAVAVAVGAGVGVAGAAGAVGDGLTCGLAAVVAGAVAAGVGVDFGAANAAVGRTPTTRQTATTAALIEIQLQARISGTDVEPIV